MVDPSASAERARGFSPAEISARVHEQLVDEQREDAVFVWQLRNHAVVSPHYLLDDFDDLDARLEANLEALVLAGPRGLALARAALEVAGPGELFGFTALAIACDDRSSFELALALAEDRELALGLDAALAWLPFELVERHVRGLIGSHDPRLARVGLAAFANARCDRIRERLPDLCMAENRALRVRALRAVGEFGHRELVPLVEHAMQLAPDDATQLAAIESLVRFGPPSTAVQTKLWRWLVAGHEHALPAALLSGRCLGLSAAAWYAQLHASPDHRRWAIALAGHVGDVGRIDDLIAAMHEPTLARAAGAALTLITGVDLAYHDLDRDPPDGFAAGPNDDPDDESVALDPEEDLPWPDPDRVAAWWSKQGEHFNAGVRRLGGQPISASGCWQTLAHAPQLLRVAAAFELARLDPTTPSFAVQAPAARQRRWIAEQRVR